MERFKKQAINQMIGKLAFSLLLVLSLPGAFAQTIVTPGSGKVQVMPDTGSFTITVGASAPTADGAVTLLDTTTSMLGTYWTVNLNQSLSQVMTVDMQLTSASSWSYNTPGRNPKPSKTYNAMKTFFVYVAIMNPSLLWGIIVPKIALSSMVTYSVTNVTFWKSMVEEELNKARMMSFMDSYKHANSFAMASNQTIKNVMCIIDKDEHGKIFKPNFNALSSQLSQNAFMLENVKVHSSVEVNWASMPI